MLTSIRSTPVLRTSLCILLCLCLQPAYSVRISGLVLDEDKQPLSFVNVFFQGTTSGTVTNEEGEFQLELEEKTGLLEFRYLGYQNAYEKVTEADSNRRLKIILQARAQLLQEAIIDGSKNPADAIIQQVMDARKTWDIEGADYQCEVYIKGLQRAEDVPEKILGQKVDLESLGLDSAGDGILYLFESVNALTFQTPSSYQESVKSSRVSGKNTAFTYVRASDLVLNFNESLVPCFDMERGVVSPIGNQAFFYYRYVLEGSYFEGEAKYYRIRFHPKRKNDPAGTGVLIIRDSLWYTESLQLTLQRENQLTLLDSLVIHTEYHLYEGHYLPVSNQLHFGLNIFGIGASGYFFTQYLKYGFEPLESVKKRPKREVLYIDDNANKRDSVYWDSIRPVPLTPMEVKDYHVKDSLEIQKAQGADSTTHSPLGWHWIWSPISGGKQDNLFSWQARSLIRSFQYNTVEGFVIEPQLELTERYPESKKIKTFTQLTLRYGFSNTRLGGRLYNESHGKKPITFSSEIAHITTAIDGDRGMDPTLNSLYSLVLGENHLKFYQRTAFGVGLKGTVLNGLELGAKYSLEHRQALQNTSEYSFNQDNNRFSANDFRSLFFNNHSVVLAELGFKFVPFNRYISAPQGKINLGSAWPVLSGKYTFGLTSNLDKINFQKLELRLDWEKNVGILGTTKISGGYGNFIQRDAVSPIDYFHIHSNPSFYQSGDNRMLRMQTLAPYSYSNSSGYFQVHVQHNFDGFLLNKVPGVRKLRGREFVGFQALSVPGKLPHYEFSIGLEQLAFHKKDPGLFRIEFIVGKSGTSTYSALRLGYTF